jgi:hypothetical protein
VTRLSSLLILSFALPGLPFALARAATLVPIEARWQYQKGTNEAANPVDAWRRLGFTDVSWSSGSAPFHYGENRAGGTALTDMRNRYSSVFLRHTFQVADRAAIAELRLRAICDDGFIAWINGVEVARVNVPSGARAFNSFASAAVAEPVSFVTTTLPPPSYLVNGANVLAVQIFNASLNSSDLQWDGELTGFEPDLEAPRIALITPAAGTVENLSQVSVTFTEPVSGVRAQDLFLGSTAATSVSGSGASYTFTFLPPESGPIELRWDGDTLITDLAAPPNRFDPFSSGTVQYQVVDRTPPRIIAISPRPGVTVRNLTEAEVRFSEAVEGVEATDLLVNGAPALRVTGQSTGPYRFEFIPPAVGEVRFAWSPGAAIHDRAEPPNAFVPQEWSLQFDPNFTVPPVRINEFLSSNVAASGLKDEEGELQDWIELHNQGAASVNLEGWALTDDRDDLGRWVFPEVLLGPGQYLVVFASGKDRKTPGPGRRLHTNFRLSPDGEYLALVAPETPRRPVSDFGANYPEQRNDYSCGYDSSGQLRYFRTPTPGSANGASAIEGVAPRPHVNNARGWYEAPFDLWMASPLPGATLRFTTDGSEPSENNGQVYTTPLRINRTTTLRVAGFMPNQLPSLTATHTYLFAEDILRQSNNPPGFPTGPTLMLGFPSDYEMDPEIVTNPLYSAKMKDALLSLPAMSIVCRTDDMFGAANGIYTHPLTRGPAWERPCSVEFIPLDHSDGFQTRAGIQIQGNAGREPQKQPKHAFRLVFKGDYGPTRLEFPLFKDSAVSRFDTLVLRSDFNTSWLHWNPTQRIRGQRTRDAWMKDSMRAMGGLASHNRYVHLFINGLYWGVYDPTEQPGADFAASYMGGDKEDYDSMNEGAAVDGDNAAYSVMVGINNLADPASYARMRQYLDVTQHIDYMLLHFYAGHQDWGQNKNWYAVRPRDGRRGFIYVPWDGELILAEPDFNRVTSPDTPSGLHSKLYANPEYRLAFADRAQKHLFNGGALTPEAVQSRWMTRANEVDLAMIAESARWGDYRRDVHPFQNGPYALYTRDNQWIAEQNRLLTQYFPRRTSTLLEQLRSAGLYPTVAAPAFNRMGGPVTPGFALRLTTSGGAAYYTLDNSDPRSSGTGAIAPRAAAYAQPIVLTNSIRVKARTLLAGVWSALVEADFQVAEPIVPLVITEIMYHPPDGDAFEFIEVQNRGQLPLDITEFSFRGIEFIFPHRTVLAPGELALAGSAISPAALAARYPGVAFTGYFRGSLANGGERIELRDRNGRIITAVEYGDSGHWPGEPDGTGLSLELRNPDGAPNDPANWIASTVSGGTPGRFTPAPAADLPAVRLSELAIQRDSADSTETDWIEIVNTGSTGVPLDGWTLTDGGSNPFRFPVGTSLDPGARLIVRCDGLTNGPALHAPFKLAVEGETIRLQDSSGRRIDAVTYGPMIPGLALSRVSVGAGVGVGMEENWVLGIPTPETPNRPAELADPSSLKINEWLADPRPGDEDWLEIYNSDSSRPASLQGLTIATDQGAFRIQSLTFIPAGGFLRLFADESSGPAHLGLKLPASAGFISLRAESGFDLDRVDYDRQAEGVSMGRTPDGGPAISSFPGRATPGLSNHSSGDQTILIHELLATSGASSGWLELFNPQPAPVDLSGFRIGLESDGTRSWVFPTGITLAAGGYLTVNFDATHEASVLPQAPLHTGRSLGTNRGFVALRNRDGRLLDSVEYGFQIIGQTIGRTASGWSLLSAPTPGAPNSSAAALGRIDGLRLNEWLAASTPDGDDFFELFNPDAKPVDLSGLRLTDDASIIGREGFVAGPLSFIGSIGFVVWTAESQPGDGTNPGAVQVNFNLNALGDALRVYGPDGTIIDAIDFGPQRSGLSQGREIDGGLPIRTLEAGPTPGFSNTTPPADRDSDGDGLPDGWEIAHGTAPGAADAESDPDGDGFTNRQEFAAGTHPLEASSHLRVLRALVENGAFTVEFASVQDRTYSILRRDALDGSRWTKVADLAAEGSNGIRRFTDSSPALETRFYRIVTPAQQ